MSGCVRRRGRGYVLVLVLFAVAIAATSMAAVCRSGLEKAVAAERAGTDLQRRWAVMTLRASLLPKAEAVLLKAEVPAAEARRAVRLGGQSFTLVFGDESAKANVNLLYARGGLAGAEREVRAAVQSTGSTLPVELRPFPGRGASFGAPDADPDQPLAFETMGQVLRGAPSAGALVVAGGGMTCWGDGTINVRRASKGALRAALGGQMPAGEIDRLVAARDKDPKRDVSDVFDELHLSDARREAAESLVTEDSNCHSLWIISADGRRNWYDLAVRDGEGDVILFGW